MGIKKLMKVVYKSTPLSTLGKKVTKDELDGMTIYIDSLNFIYRALTARKETETSAHIDMILYYYNVSLNHNVKFSWIFDPVETPDIKKPEQERRKLNRTLSVSITPNIINESIELIKNLGMELYVCYSIEAEHYASILSKRTANSAVLSRDTDVLMYGANLLIYSVNATFILYNIYEILTFYEINQEQFIDICLLLGTDYAPKTDGVGIKSVVNKVINNKYTLSDAQNIARAHIIKTEDINCESIKSSINKGKVINLLKEKGFTSTNNHVNKLITMWNIELDM